MPNIVEKNIKSVLVISRHWNNPHITVHISDDRIAIEIPADDFLKAVAQEITHPALILTRDQLEAELLNALDVTLNKIKESSAAAV